MLHAAGIPKRAVELAKGTTRLPPRLPYVCDPSAGSGTFIIETMKTITQALQTMPRNGLPARTTQALDAFMPFSKPHKWAETYLYGVEINRDLALASKVNMIVHGDGSVNIYAEDGLAEFSAYEAEGRVSVLHEEKPYADDSYGKTVNERFDYIVTNPPFSIKPDRRTSEAYSERFEFGASDKSENLFLERWFQLLRPDGRISAVLPESVFDTGSAKVSRLFLYRYFRVDAVISLPYLAFKPFTSTKTCVLIATKKSAADAKRYIEAEKAWGRSISKVLRRGVAFSKANSLEERKKVMKSIERDDSTDRELLAEILKTDPFLSDLEDGLSACSSGFWGSIDETGLVFRKVSEQFNYSVFFADVADVGYKRRRQGRDLVLQNELFNVNDLGDVVVLPNGEITLDKMAQGSKLRNTRNAFRSDFKMIARQASLRCDPKYRWFWDHQRGEAIPEGRRDLVPLKTFLTEFVPDVVIKGPLESERALIELDDVESGTGKISNVQTVEEIGSNKIAFGKADIAFSQLEPYLGKAFIIDSTLNLIGSTEWMLFSLCNGHPGFWLSFLLSPKMRDVYRMLQSGKRHARLNVQDLGNVLVPNFGLEQQEQTVSELTP